MENSKLCNFYYEFLFDPIIDSQMLEILFVGDIQFQVHVFEFAAKTIFPNCSEIIVCKTINWDVSPVKMFKIYPPLFQIYLYLGQFIFINLKYYFQRHICASICPSVVRCVSED